MEFWQEEEDKPMRYYILPVVAGVLMMLYLIPLIVGKGPPSTLIDPSFQAEEIEVKKGDSDYHFKKTDSGWVMQKPIKWKADEERINRLLEKLKNTVLENPITDDPDKYGIYKLSEDSDYILLKGPTGEQKVYVGKRGPRYSLVYVRRDRDKTVYLVDAGVADALPSGRDDFRDKTILKIDQRGIEAIRWQKEKETFVMQKREGRWYAREEPLNDEEVKEYLTFISDLKATGFPKKDRLPEGADRVGIIEVDTSGGVKKMEVFKADKQHYIIHEGHPYRVSDYTVERLFSRPKSSATPPSAS